MATDYGGIGNVLPKTPVAKTNLYHWQSFYNGQNIIVYASGLVKHYWIVV